MVLSSFAQANILHSGCGGKVHITVQALSYWDELIRCILPRYPDVLQITTHMYVCVKICVPQCDHQIYKCSFTRAH